MLQSAAARANLKKTAFKYRFGHFFSPHQTFPRVQQFISKVCRAYCRHYQQLHRNKKRISTHWRDLSAKKILSPLSKVRCKHFYVKTQHKKIYYPETPIINIQYFNAKTRRISISRQTKHTPPQAPPPTPPTLKIIITTINSSQK